MLSAGEDGYGAVCKIRSSYPLKSLKDDADNSSNLGATVGFVVNEKKVNNHIFRSIINLDYDDYRKSKNNIYSCSLMAQFDIYAHKDDPIYCIVGAGAQRYHERGITGKPYNCSSFVGQVGFGYNVNHTLLKSVEVTYEAMDQVESRNFSRIRFDIRFEF
jgi:hypothetical protein